QTNPRTGQRPLRCGLLLRCHQCVVELFRTHTCSPRADALPILLESRPFFHCAEHQAETDRRTDIDIGGAESVAKQIFLLGYGPFERIHRLLECAVTHHTFASRRNYEIERLIAYRGFDWTRGEEHPAVIWCALTVTRRRCELGRREGVGEISTDRRGLGD